MNNIGGVIKCETILINSIDSFQVSRRGVTITLKSGTNWRQLPISPKQTIANATPEKNEGGILYQHNFQTILPYKPNLLQDMTYYNQCCSNGCLIRYTDANLRTRILGTKEIPLTGTLEEIAGESATDLAGYRLELSAMCLTPQLIYNR